MNQNGLKNIFTKFSNNKNEMEGKELIKMNKDCKLLDKKLTTTDIDIIFAKVKTKGLKKISFEQFSNAMELIAGKKGISLEELVKKLELSKGPQFKGTKAEYNKFHDDKSLYTGVYANGGPTNVDAGKGKISDISQLCDRTGANVRGVKY